MFFFDNVELPTVINFDNYFSDIASVHKYQERLASLQKYHLPRIKTSLCQLSSTYIHSKIWSNIFENLKSLSPYSFGKQNRKRPAILPKFLLI